MNSLSQLSRGEANLSAGEVDWHAAFTTSGSSAVGNRQSPCRRTSIAAREKLSPFSTWPLELLLCTNCKSCLHAHTVRRECTCWVLQQNILFRRSGPSMAQATFQGLRRVLQSISALTNCCHDHLLVGPQHCRSRAQRQSIPIRSTILSVHKRGNASATGWASVVIGGQGCNQTFWVIVWTLLLECFEAGSDHTSIKTAAVLVHRILCHHLPIMVMNLPNSLPLDPMGRPFPKFLVGTPLRLVRTRGSCLLFVRREEKRETRALPSLCLSSSCS